jgi:hypothetical protein
MERHQKFLVALTDFAQAARHYSYVFNVSANKSTLSSDLKILKKKASILLAEYKTIPAESQSPELLEKINKVLAL